MKANNAYASNWLPEDYNKRNISGYTQRIFDSIIEDTVKHNKQLIINRINNFDDLVSTVISSIYPADKEHSSQEIFYQEVSADLKKSITNMRVNQSLKYNPFFDKGNKFFQSRFLGIFLTYYKDHQFASDDEKELLGNLLKSIFQLHIGALSSEISGDVEDTVFSNQSMDIDFFDELGGSLSVNYEAAGISGLKLIASKNNKINDNIINLVYSIVEEIYSEVLDYKTLIDENWHYLYIPKNEWGKFSKIVVFLYTVRDYLMEMSKQLDSKKSGYYTELKNELDNKRIEANVIGTTNYNSFIKNTIGRENIHFLNGGVDIFYDPYMNNLIENREKYFSENDDPHIIVPLLFTQSGTKPMTSIDMSKNYVDFYEGLKDSDFICSIGFGFNNDDEHINGIIRTLIERDNKKLYIVDCSAEDKDELKTKYTNQLKVTKINNIHIIKVSNSRKLMDSPDKMWYEAIETIL